MSLINIAPLNRDLNKVINDREPMQHAMGQAGKKATFDELQSDLGPDRGFSGLRRKVKLGAGYDVGANVVLNLRPAGLWVLLDKGRRRSKTIRPRKKGGAKALITPYGYRASAKSTPSKGKKTLTRLERRLATSGELTRAVDKIVGKNIQRLFS